MREAYLRLMAIEHSPLQTTCTFHNQKDIHLNSVLRCFANAFTFWDNGILDLKHPCTKLAEIERKRV